MNPTMAEMPDDLDEPFVLDFLGVAHLPLSGEEGEECSPVGLGETDLGGMMLSEEELRVREGVGSGEGVAEAPPAGLLPGLTAVNTMTLD